MRTSFRSARCHVLSGWLVLILIPGLRGSAESLPASTAGDGGAVTEAAPARQVSFQHGEGRVTILVGDMPFADYIYESKTVRRPFLAHVRALSGSQVTRRFPPVAGEDAVDHATMHPGVWLGLGDLNGADFWRNVGAVRHAQFLKDPTADGGAGGFTVLNRYESDNGALAEETAEWRFVAGESGVLVVYDGRFRPVDKPLHFGDQEEMGFAFRVATPLAVKSGGWMVDNFGRRNEEGIWGKTADWVAYGGRVGGETLGLLMMPSPSNFRPSWMHARDYGFLTANPFGRNAFKHGKPSDVLVEPGDTLRLRYGVFVFSTREEAVDFEAIYRDFLSRERTPRN